MRHEVALLDERENIASNDLMVAIKVDLAAAILIADALDIVDPDDDEARWCAREIAADIKAEVS